ncbi:MAG: hypothetical protein H0W99_15780, partial [Acidobacteria bacterium]|nr:hypothetical protein [Acidobacteriota bacterium]
LRLMPALVLINLLVCGYVYLRVPDMLPQTGAGALLSLSYVSNWYFALRNEYALNPFGVTWSLAIEEQFYLGLFRTFDDAARLVSAPE